MKNTKYPCNICNEETDQALYEEHGSLGIAIMHCCATCAKAFSAGVRAKEAKLRDQVKQLDEKYPSAGQEDDFANAVLELFNLRK